MWVSSCYKSRNILKISHFECLLHPQTPGCIPRTRHLASCRRKPFFRFRKTVTFSRVKISSLSDLLSFYPFVYRICRRKLKLWFVRLLQKCIRGSALSPYWIGNHVDWSILDTVSVIVLLQFIKSVRVVWNNFHAKQFFEAFKIQEMRKQFELYAAWMQQSKSFFFPYSIL